MKRLLTVLAAGAALSAVVAAPASAAHSWNNYHWARTSNPFPLKVGDNVSAVWDAQYGTSNADWTASSVLDVAPVAGSARKRCAMTAGTVQVCNSSYGSTGWLGLATIYLSGGTHITQGSAKMNDTYFSTAIQQPQREAPRMCQEVGHTFGLGHTTEDGSSQDTCMDYFSNTGANATSTVSTRPNQHDFDVLASVYEHLDATSTLASSPATSAGMAGRSDARPFRAKRIDRGSHTEIVEDFSDGTTRITDVTWADGPRPTVDRGE